MSLTKSKIISLFNLIYDEIISVIIIVITIIYSITQEKYYYLFIPVLLLINLFLKNKKVFIIISIIILIIITRLVIKEIVFNNYQYKEIDDTYFVENIDHYDDYDKLYLKKGIYNFVSNSTKFKNIKLGDYILIKGTIEKVSLNETFKGFNYYTYLKNKNIIGKITINDLQVVKHSFNINNIHFNILNYISNLYENKYSSIISCLTIGDKTLMDDDLSSSISNLGISHLFVISGLHMELVYSFIYLILKKTKLKDKTKDIIVLIVLVSYYCLTIFMVSILRVIVSFFINKVLNKYISYHSPPKNILLNASIVLFINPCYLLSFSFLLSYIIVFGILIISKYLKKDNSFKSFIINNTLISLSSTIISIPIISLMGSSINILSIIYNLFFIPYVSYLLLPSCIIGLIPFLKFIPKIFINIFIFISDILNKINILTITFPYPSELLFILFYFLYILLVISTNKKLKLSSIISLLIILISWYSITIINVNNSITFLSLSKGESTVCVVNNYCIVIDTGDEDSGLIEYLEEEGIHTIDLLILTHSDSDHIGDTKKLLEKNMVKNICLNCLDTGYNDYFAINKNIMISYLKESDYINNKYFNIKVLSPSKKLNDINNDSLVFILNVFNLNILFCADIEKERENLLKDEIKKYKIDILKVSHHGSSTSSSLEFIKNCNPLISIAMNGYNNMYNFPSNITINTFNTLGYTLLNTKYLGSIRLYYKFKKYYFYSSFYGPLKI